MKRTLRLALVLALPAGVLATPGSLSLLPQPAPPSALPAAKAKTRPAKVRIVPMTETIPDVEARLELARVLSYLERYDESLREYGKVIAERPEDFEAKGEHAQVLFWSGRPAEAYAELSRIPRDQLNPELRLTLADLSVAQGKFPEAAAIYEERVKAAPDDLVARFKLAEVLSWLKRYDESLALFRGLVTERPADVQLRRRYGLVLMWSGQLDKAAAELRRSLSDL